LCVCTSTPILTSVAETIFGVIIPALADFGKAIAPGLKVFFDQIGQGFKILGEVLNDPATISGINQFLGALGGALLGVVKELGPKIPSIIQALADALTTLAPTLPMMADVIAACIPDLVRLIELLASPEVADAISGMADMTSKIILLTDALGGGWVGAIGLASYLFMGFAKSVRESIDGVVEKFTLFIGSIFNWGQDSINAFTTAIGGIQDKLANFAKDAFNWGKDIFKNLAEGMLSQLGPVGDAAKWLYRNGYMLGNADIDVGVAAKLLVQGNPKPQTED